MHLRLKKDNLSFMQEQITVRKRHPRQEAFVYIDEEKRDSDDDDDKSENCVFVYDGSAEMMMFSTNLSPDSVLISFIASGLKAIAWLNSCFFVGTPCCGGQTHTLTTQEGMFVRHSDQHHHRSLSTAHTEDPTESNKTAL